MSIAEAKHAESNGVLKINLPKRGRVKFQFNDDDVPFEIDVIEVYDQWFEVDWKHRDKEGVLPKDKWNEHGKDRQEFVQAIVNDAYAKIPDAATPNLSRAEAEAFVTAIITEARKLRDFFLPKDEMTSSSPESSPAQRLNFSQ